MNPILYGPNGKELKGAARTAKLKAILAANNPTRRTKNAAPGEADINVRAYSRRPGPNQRSRRESLIKFGQRDLFAPDATKEELLGYLKRRNPTILQAVQKKLGRRFETASATELQDAMKSVLLAAGRKSRRNPDGDDIAELAELYGEFQGRYPDDLDKIQTPAWFPDSVYKLGDLVQMDLQNRPSVIFPEISEELPNLTADVNKKLWILGGDYALAHSGLQPLAVLPELYRREIEERRLPADTEFLDFIEVIHYITVKEHINDGQETLYYHQFSEEIGGVDLPALCVGRGKLLIVGGRYTITERGLEN
jgi:hypothetical protein